MKKITLRTLELSDQKEFISAVNEPWESDFVFAHYFESIALNSFEKYVQVLPEFSKGLLIPSDHVPSTLLFAFESTGKLVGRVSIRHSISGHLLNIGGHIGYGVIPSQRRKGFATEILKEKLTYVRDVLPELNRLLLTCDETNIGSIKTIEQNGGILENIYKTPEMKVGKRRYWINIPRN